MKPEMPGFFLFRGDRYYPRPGAFDNFGVYNSLEEAKEGLEVASDFDWAHIAIVNHGILVVVSDYSPIVGWKDKIPVQMNGGES